MRVFLDTNILVSAATTRGVCTDLVRHVLTEHELVLGEVVLAELREILLDKLGMAEATASAFEQFLRQHEVVPRPLKPSSEAIRDPDDAWVLANALEGDADLLVTGDRDLLELPDPPLLIVSPRGYWALVRGTVEDA